MSILPDGSKERSCLWVIQHMVAHARISPAGTAWSRSEDTQSELKLSYNPWLFSACLPKETLACSRHGRAPHQNAHQQSLLSTCCDVSPAAMPAATAPLPPASAFSVCTPAFLWICLIQRIRPHKPPYSEGTIPARDTFISGLQNMTNNCQTAHSTNSWKLVNGWWDETVVQA